MTDHTCPQCGFVMHDPYPPRPLTRIQWNVLDYLRRYHAEHGYAPSFEEIAANFGYQSLATVHEHLKILEHKGYIVRRYNEARAIEFLT